MNPVFRTITWIFLVLALFTACQPEAFLIGQMEEINQDIAEPSGIVFHAERGTLFAVGDEGTIAEITLDGVNIQKTLLFGNDFEGITYNPDTGMLYAIVEGDDTILELTADDLIVQRTFTIERDFQGTTLLPPGGDGIEAITFIPDRQHSEGGLFYVTDQSMGTAETADFGLLIEVEAPLQSNQEASATAIITDYFTLEGHSDLSGLHYDNQSDSFYIISDSLDEVLKVTRAGKLQNSVYLPGNHQEGITFDHDGFLYIAQDSGGIVKFTTQGKR